MVAKDTAIIDPVTSLEAKFSATHAIAAALADGELGLRQYDVDRVQAEPISAIRKRISFHVDASIARDAAILRFEMADGSSFTQQIAHARGSKARPMTDEDLLQKTKLLFVARLPGREAAAWDTIRALDGRPARAPLRKALTP